MMSLIAAFSSEVGTGSVKNTQNEIIEPIRF